MTEKNINIVQSKNNKYSNAAAEFFATVGAVLSCAAFLLLFGEGFASVKNYVIIAVGAALICAAVLVLKKIGRYIALGFTALSIILALMLSVMTKSGMFLMANDFLDFLSLKTGKIYLDFSAEGSALPEIVFTIIAAFTVLLLSTAVSTKSIIPIIPVAAIATIGCSCGFLSTGVYLFLLFFGMILLCLGIFIPVNHSAADIKTFAAVLTFVLICSGAALLPAYLIDGTSSSLRTAIDDAVHSLLYDSGSNSMPEGNLHNLKSRGTSDAPALEIKIEQPQKLYIKGFVGEVYDGQRWTTLPKETLAEYKDTFFWLHQNGFYAQSENAAACSLADSAVLKKIEVKNLSACKKYAFVPYSLADSGTLDASLIGDSTVFANGSSYSAEYAPIGLAEIFKAQIELSNNQKSSAKIADYITSESAYRDFVYANYLDLPETAEAAISYHLKDESSALTFTEIIETITNYLESNIEYDEKAVTPNGDTDFLKYFLDSSNRGYSVHYATAATAMLRYFGVPSRYVEGYFISAAEAATYGENAVITLDESHAHAWAEYYLDGVGWVPFETTPRYMDDELEQAAFSFSGESGKLYYQSDKPITNVIKKENKDKLTELQNSFRFNAVYLVFPLIAALIAFIIYIIMKRRRLCAKLDAIEKADNKSAIAMQFGYAEMLRRHVDVPPEALRDMNYDSAFTINKEALFSEHQMTSEQRSSVFEYSAKMLEFCKKRWNTGQRLLNRWIKCLYIK